MKKHIILFSFFLIFIHPIISSSKTYDLNSKYVALTFDDGPSNYTNAIADYLFENDSEATFFIVGSKASLYQKELKYIIDKGHEIGNHTYSHPWLTHLNNNEILDEINKTQQAIIEITGYTPKVFRPSYGDINKDLRKLINLKVVMWNNDSHDWKYKSTKKIASNIIRNIKENDIILMHDTYKRSLEALKIIIPKLKELNYKIVTASELLEIRRLRELYKY